MSLAGGFRGGAVLGVTGEKGCPDGIEGKSLKQRKSRAMYESAVMTGDRVKRDAEGKVPGSSVNLAAERWEGVRV